MIIETLKEKLEQLSPELQIQVEKDIDLLLKNKSAETMHEKPRSKYGDLKGFVKYIADDFDEPLEEFKEYM
jgi:hypothetical protein